MKKSKNVHIKSGIESADKKNYSWQLWGYSITLFLFAFLLYGHTLNFDFVLDDELVTRQNTFVQKGVEGIPEILSNGFLAGYSKVSDLARPQYRPFILVHLAIEKQFFGVNPMAHHFFNVFYYALTGVLLFLLLRKILVRSSVGNHDQWAVVTNAAPFLISMLFMAHPIHTEVVSNIKSRDEIFAFLFLLTSLLTLFQYTINRKKSLLIVSVISCFLALLSKESALTFIAVIPLFLFCFTNERLKSILLLTAPFLAAAVVFLVIRSLVVQRALPPPIDPLYNALLAIPSLSHRLATAIMIIGKYILLLFYPHPLVWDYSYNQVPEAGWQNPYVILSVVVCAALIVYAILKLKSRNVFAFSILFFFLTLSLTSNLVIYIGSTMAERFLYAPSLGFCIAVFFLLKKLLSGGKILKTVPLYFILSVILVAYSYKTFARSKDWENGVTLLMAGVRDSPNSAKTHIALAQEIAMYGKKSPDSVISSQLFEKAIEEFNTGLKIYPNNAEGWYNLGLAYHNLRNYAEAEKAYKKAMSLNSSAPEAYLSMGVIHAQKEEYQLAIPYFEKAVALDSNYADAFGYIGTSYSKLGEYEKAAGYFDKAVKINPDNEIINRNMAENNWMLMRKGR